MAGSRQTGACAAGVVAALAMLPAAPALAAKLRIGGAGSIPRAALAIAPAPPRTRLHVTFTLAPRDPRALAAFARAVSTPGSALYRRFLTPAQFGRRFGATAGEIGLVAHWLRARGLTPGPVSAGRLSIRVSASVGTIEHGLRIGLRRLLLTHGRRALVASAAGSIPAPVARAVESVVGLDTMSARRPLLARPQPSAGQVRAAARNSPRGDRRTATVCGRSFDGHRARRLHS